MCMFIEHKNLLVFEDAGNIAKVESLDIKKEQ